MAYPSYPAHSSGSSSQYENYCGMPIIMERFGRFCPYCGTSVKDFKSKSKCDECKHDLDHMQPKLEDGFYWCPRCRLGFCKRDWHNCRLCGWVTYCGKEQDKMKEEMKKKNIEMTIRHEEEFKASVEKLRKKMLTPKNPRAKKARKNPPSKLGLKKATDDKKNEEIDPTMAKDETPKQNDGKPPTNDVDGEDALMDTTDVEMLNMLELLGSDTENSKEAAE